MRFSILVLTLRKNTFIRNCTLPKKMEPTPPRSVPRANTHRYGFVMRPGMKAAVAGVHYALVGESLKRTAEQVYGLYQKKQKTAASMPTKKTTVKKTTRRSKPSKTSVVKQTLLGMAATYHDTQNDSTVNINPMLHSVIYTNNVTAQIGVGTTNSSRQGDQIYMKGLRVQGNVFTDVLASAYQYRVMVVMSGEEYDFGMSFGAGLTPDQIFLPATGGLFQSNGIVNTKAITVLYDQMIQINSQVAGALDTAGVSFYVPLNRKFQYKEGGSEFGKSKNLYLVIIGDAAGGGLGVTDSGSCQFSTDLNFKNL